ncbi:sodium:solute symporter family transporter [Streptomyces naphthomycinicus]|uniref:sodium:solute symporter family transporter n=1 Tax=Streptomyces naphthomycinicus TaxID=2872625 RepID=UPI001CED0842|nr:hypothetical protein [Streptomyces sp. TML10]
MPDRRRGEDTVSGFLTANRTLASLRNGIAMCGDYISVTALIETIKVALAFGTFTLAAVLVLSRFGFGLGTLLQQAATGSGRGEAYFEPGQLYGSTFTGGAERLSVCLTLALGTGVLPPLLMRISASRTSRTARRSARHALIGFAAFSLVLTILGLGAAALVGAREITATGEQGYPALFLLFDTISGTGGGVFYTLFACAVFGTALGAVPDPGPPTAVHEADLRCMRGGAGERCMACRPVHMPRTLRK